MILQGLKELAEREHLLQVPDYEPKPVQWIITVGDQGQFLGLASTVVAAPGDKRPHAKKIPVPRQSGRTSAASAEFLVDKSEYVLGVLPPSSRTARSSEALDERRTMFLEKVRHASDATHSAALAAVRRFLESESARKQCVAELGTDYKSNDLFAFRYACGPPGSFVHLDATVMKHWQGLRNAPERATTQCVVCGQACVAVNKHPALRRVPGGSTSGVALVSFNADAFESLGLERNENAPFCRPCADAYTTALNRCLDDHYPDPTQEGAFLPRRSIRLSSDTTGVYWATKDSPLLDWLADILNGADEQAIAALFGSPYQGRLLEVDSSRFFALILSGAKGRAILRGTHIGTIEEAAAQLRRYFSDISIVPDRPLPLYRLLGSLALLGKMENLPPNLVGSLFLCAIAGTPYPRWVYSAALNRARAEGKNPVPRERAAIIKAFLIRNCGKEISMALDQDSVEPGYRVGRLFAVLENLQTRAIHNVSASITDRYYGAASTRPATVFAALLKTAQHHAAKLAGGGAFHQKLIGEIVEGISSFPATLDLNQQGLFALGYYHQRQALFTKAEAPNTASV